VLRTAVALADQRTDVPTMRTLAQELGVVPMALYKHVANKEELVDSHQHCKHALADTMVVVVDPDRLPGRLEAAGFEEPLVTTRAGRLRFRARRPGGHTPR
jgi:hypothetical protein